MKKTNMIALCLCMCCSLFMCHVNAESNFYKNDNGVVLNEKEYNFYSDFYWNGYQKYLTVKDYEEIKAMDIFDKEIQKKRNCKLFTI